MGLCEKSKTPDPRFEKMEGLTWGKCVVVPRSHNSILNPVRFEGKIVDRKLSQGASSGGGLRAGWYVPVEVE